MPDYGIRVSMKGEVMRKSIISSAIVTALAIPSANAAEMKITGGGFGVIIRGVIEPADFESFKATTSSLTNLRTIGLESDGGNVLAALQIGEFIHAHEWRTYVP